MFAAPSANAPVLSEPGQQASSRPTTGWMRGGGGGGGAPVMSSPAFSSHVNPGPAVSVGSFSSGPTQGASSSFSRGGGGNNSFSRGNTSGGGDRNSSVLSAPGGQQRGGGPNTGSPPLRGRGGGDNFSGRGRGRGGSNSPSRRNNDFRGGRGGMDGRGGRGGAFADRGGGGGSPRGGRGGGEFADRGGRGGFNARGGSPRGGRGSGEGGADRGGRGGFSDRGGRGSPRGGGGRGGDSNRGGFSSDRGGRGGGSGTFSPMNLSGGRGGNQSSFRPSATANDSNNDTGNNETMDESRPLNTPRGERGSTIGERPTGSSGNNNFSAFSKAKPAISEKSSPVAPFKMAFPSRPSGSSGTGSGTFSSAPSAAMPIVKDNDRPAVDDEDANPAKRGRDDPAVAAARGSASSSFTSGRPAGGSGGSGSFNPMQRPGKIPEIAVAANTPSSLNQAPPQRASPPSRPAAPLPSQKDMLPITSEFDRLLRTLKANDAEGAERVLEGICFGINSRTADAELRKAAEQMTAVASALGGRDTNLVDAARRWVPVALLLSNVNCIEALIVDDMHPEWQTLLPAACERANTAFKCLAEFRRPHPLLTNRVYGVACRRHRMIFDRAASVQLHTVGPGAGIQCMHIFRNMTADEKNLINIPPNARSGADADTIVALGHLTLEMLGSPLAETVLKNKALLEFARKFSTRFAGASAHPHLVVGLHYRLGILFVTQDAFGEALEEFTAAFDACPMDHPNRGLVLSSLVITSLALGTSPIDSLAEEVNGHPPIADMALAVRTGSLPLYNAAIIEHSAFFLQRGLLPLAQLVRQVVMLQAVIKYWLSSGRPSRVELSSLRDSIVIGTSEAMHEASMPGVGLVLPLLQSGRIMGLMDAGTLVLSKAQPFPGYDVACAEAAA